MVRLYLKLTSNNKMNTPTEDLTTLSQSLLFYYSIRVNTTEVVDDIDTRIFKKSLTLSIDLYLAIRQF